MVFYKSVERDQVSSNSAPNANQQAIILAAGQGIRLKPDTDNLPKTLLPVSDDDTIIDTIVANLAEAGFKDIAIVTGHAAEALEKHAPTLKARFGVNPVLVDNDRPDWNNAYSLWCAREYFADGALVVNGDTLHPVSVEHTILDTEPKAINLAIDDVKELTDEAMKVRLNDKGTVSRITKEMPVDGSFGEFIGISRINADVAPSVTDALQEIWKNQPNLYYEDAYQLLAADGLLRPAPIGKVEWVEVDDHTDLEKARQLACRS